MVALVLAWVVPYARSGPVQALGERLSSEVAQRTTASGGAEALRHLSRYPLVLLGATAPWSLLLLPLATPRGRAALRGLLDDAWLGLCGAVVAWGVLVFVVVPGVLPRYLIPVLPAAATLAAAALGRLDRPRSLTWPWAALAAAWATTAPLAARGQLAELPAPRAALLTAALVGLGILVIGAAREVARRFGAATAALLASGLLYGLAFAGIAETRAAHRHEALVTAAEALAPRVRSQVPVVVPEGTDRRFTWPLAHRLDRLVVERPPDPPYDLVGPADTPVPARSRLVAASGGYALWRVRAARPGEARPGDDGR
jgi:hypothetical protein